MLEPQTVGLAHCLAPNCYSPPVTIDGFCTVCHELAPAWLSLDRNRYRKRARNGHPDNLDAYRAILRETAAHAACYNARHAAQNLPVSASVFLTLTLTRDRRPHCATN